MPGGIASEGGPEAVFGHAPEIVVDAVDQRNRNLFPVLTQVFLRLSDITFLPGNADILRHPADHQARIVAKVAARPAEQRDPGRRHLTAAVSP